MNGPPNTVAPEIEESEMVCIHLVGKIKTLLFVSYNYFFAYCNGGHLNASKHVYYVVNV